MRELRCAGHDGAEIVLGGGIWIMADLAPRQLRKVIPAVIALTQAPALDEAAIDRLVDALYWALTRNYPDLGREEFLDCAIALPELLAALPALAAAAGIERAEARPPGESHGAAARSATSSIA